MTPVGWNVEYESQESRDGNSGMKTTGTVPVDPETQTI